MRRAAITVLALTLLATGCDDGESGPLTKAEYEERVRAVVADNDSTRSRFVTVVESSGEDDADEVVDAFRDFADRLRGDRYVLDELEPPAAIARDHHWFVDILRGEADAHECAANAIEEADDVQKARDETQLCLQYFYDDEKYYFGGVEYLRTLRKAGYGIRPELKSHVHPDVPHRFLGSE